MTELNTKYSIPKKLAQVWVEQDQLLLLLDGLDEVKAAYRNDCVNIINTFRQEHLVNLAICCRSEEHQGLTAQLKLVGALHLLPLTIKQMDAYLASAGKKLAAVQSLLRHDAVLQELAESPLTLNVMTLAYQDKPMEEIQLSGSFVSRRSHLFDAYIARMFVRPGRSRSVLYKRQQTLQIQQRHQTGVMRRLQEVGHFMHDDAFEAFARFLSEVGVEPNVVGGTACLSGSRYHASTMACFFS